MFPCRCSWLMTRLLFHKHEQRQRWEFLRWLHSGLVVSVTQFFMSEGLYRLLDDRILNKLQIFELNFAFCLLIWIINEFRYDEPENFPENFLLFWDTEQKGAGPVGGVKWRKLKIDFSTLWENNSSGVGGNISALNLTAVLSFCTK